LLEQPPSGTDLQEFFDIEIVPEIMVQDGIGKQKYGCMGRRALPAHRAIVRFFLTFFLGNQRFCQVYHASLRPRGIGLIVIYRHLFPSKSAGLD
jgi:hypothetical protein